MSIERNNSPPDVPTDMPDSYFQEDDTQEHQHLLIGGAIVAILILLIVSALFISLSIPRSGNGKGNTNLADGSIDASSQTDQGIKSGGVAKPQGIATTSDQSGKASSTETSSLPSNTDPSSELQSEKDNENSQSVTSPKSDAVDRKLSESAEGNGVEQVAEQPTAEAGMSAEEDKLEGNAIKKDREDVFTIDLPKPAKIDRSTAPSNSIVANSPMRQRSAEERLEKLEANGGTEESELAVAAALEWLASHQLPNGQWSFDHRPCCDGTCGNSSQLVNAQQDPTMLANAATGMGLLPFLGAGFTHRDGKYRDVVKKGITFLLQSQQRDASSSKLGSWMEFTGFMYSHGIASMAICEAYAMTEDQQLKPAAQAGVNFIAMAQHGPGGGWRYQPREPGDMSMLGWHLMALKSGQLGELSVDINCFSGAERFIESLRIGGSGAYGYSTPVSDGDDNCTTAIGALGLYYLGRPSSSIEQQASARYLIQSSPQLNDLYGLYYSTQTVMHLGGDDWPAWNQAVREHLISSQAKEGHAKGSWFVEGHGTHRTGLIGGRLYCTAMSAMILEVYYRHLPLYVTRNP
jgi:hypothetical protein